MTTTFVLVRHGQSTWNAERRWQGQADPPLSDLGRQQARLAASALGELVSRFDAAVSSPQKRAAETADILLASSSALTGLEEIDRVPDLRERSAGPWSGLTKEEIDAQYPGYLEQNRRPDGYEPDDSLFDRVRLSLLNLASGHFDRHVLAVCHGGVINTLAEGLGGATGRMPNLSGYFVTADERDLTLGQRFNLLDADQQTGGDSARV